MKTLIKNTDITLNNNVKMPMLGLGTGSIREADSILNAVTWAFANGYRHIDTADVYQNHHFIQKALTKLAKPRSSFFLTSKFYLKEDRPITHDEVVAHIDRFLKELKVAYLDLLLLHAPEPTSIVAYKALETCLFQKKTRAIGVSNFSIKQLKSLISHTDVLPAVNQFQMSPGLRRTELVEFCHSQNINVVSWRTLGGDFNLLDHPTIIKIAQKYHVSGGQICLRWAVQQNIIVIPKSVNEARIKTNSELDGFMLTESDMTAINAIEEHQQWWPFSRLDSQEVNW